MRENQQKNKKNQINKIDKGAKKWLNLIAQNILRKKLKSLEPKKYKQSQMPLKFRL